jgi:hypothetical protein
MKIRAGVKYLCILLCIIITVIATLLLMVLRFNLDALIQPPIDFLKPTQSVFYSYKSAELDELTLRRYGEDNQACAIFFPGRSGAIASYEKSLFPLFTEVGLQVFALSYPGQDGNSGKLKLATLSEQVENALEHINDFCSMNTTVFVGRSLGSTVAVFAALKWQPKSIFLEGASGDLASVISVKIAEQGALQSISYSLIKYFLQNNFEINRPLLDYLSKGGKGVIFHGELDSVTPFSSLKSRLIQHPNLKLFVIEGANHSNTYLKAKPHYIEILKQSVK